MPSPAPSPALDLFDCDFSATNEEGDLDLYAFDEQEQRLLLRLARRISMEQLAGVLMKLARYLVEDEGRSKIQGAGIRAFVFASSILPSMHGLTQTDLGTLLGLHKQSVGRQVSRFRDLFGVAWGAMQTEQAREACRKREAKKVEVKFGEDTQFEVGIDYQI